MEMDTMTRTEGIEAMEKSECVKEKCPYYEPYAEYAYDGCIFGASLEHKEEDRGCNRQEMEQG